MIDQVSGLAAAGPDEKVLDPYFVLARRTDFAGYQSTGGQPLGAYAVSVQLTGPDVKHPQVTGLKIREAYVEAEAAYLTGTVTPEDYDELLLDKNVARVQFAQPLLAPRTLRSRRTSFPTPQLQPAAGNSTPRSDTLLGIVDNGCPFAHQALRSGSSTRILSLWNQDQETCPADLGTVPAKFGYGREFSRVELNQLLATATDAAGSVDEDLCYRLAGYEQVFRRRTHAAHSLGLLVMSRPSGLRPERFRPTLESSPAGSDIVFVQLPQTLMDCITVAALEHHAVDGFRHILAITRRDGYKKVVISFGYESWVGPHDGSSWFEGALASLVQEAKTKGIQLTFFLAAGNSRNRQSHAALRAAQGTASLQWQVPPGNEVPTFLEIWVPTTEKDLTVEVTPPGQPPLGKLHWGESLLFPATGQPSVGIVMHRSTVLGTGGYVILIRVSPTQSWDSARGAAPHGIWTVTLEGVQPEEPASNEEKEPKIHAYLGRVEGDANSPHRAHQPIFVGRSRDKDAMDKARTLNGHACGQGSRVCGVFYPNSFPYGTVPDEHGGMQFARSQPADYSGAGPAGHRPRPDVSLPMEDGLYHEGTLSIGTRSACVWRMKGTSTAAPAAARLFAEGLLEFPAHKGEGGGVPAGDLALGAIVWTRR
jgi:hypothetical protein